MGGYGDVFRDTFRCFMVIAAIVGIAAWELIKFLIQHINIGWS